MRDILSDLSDAMSDPDPVRRAQIQMKRPLPKRFYKAVSTDRTDEGFRILLDGRPVRTPGKKLLAVPNQVIDNAYGKNSRYVGEWTGASDIVELIAPVAAAA